MNRELLEKPFEPSQIKQREGMFGKTWTTSKATPLFSA